MYFSTKMLFLLPTLISNFLIIIQILNNYNGSMMVESLDWTNCKPHGFSETLLISYDWRDGSLIKSSIALQATLASRLNLPFQLARSISCLNCPDIQWPSAPPTRFYSIVFLSFTTHTGAFNDKMLIDLTTALSQGSLVIIIGSIDPNSTHYDEFLDFAYDIFDTIPIPLNQTKTATSFTATNVPTYNPVSYTPTQDWKLTTGHILNETDLYERHNDVEIIYRWNSPDPMLNNTPALVAFPIKDSKGSLWWLQTPSVDAIALNDQEWMSKWISSALTNHYRCNPDLGDYLVLAYEKQVTSKDVISAYYFWSAFSLLSRANVTILFRRRETQLVSYGYNSFPSVETPLQRSGVNGGDLTDPSYNKSAYQRFTDVFVMWAPFGEEEDNSEIMNFKEILSTVMLNSSVPTITKGFGVSSSYEAKERFVFLIGCGTTTQWLANSEVFSRLEDETLKALENNDKLSFKYNIQSTSPSWFTNSLKMTNVTVDDARCYYFSPPELTKNNPTVFVQKQGSADQLGNSTAIRIFDSSGLRVLFWSHLVPAARPNTNFTYDSKANDTMISFGKNLTLNVLKWRIGEPKVAPSPYNYYVTKAYDFSGTALIVFLVLVVFVGCSAGWLIRRSRALNQRRMLEQTQGGFNMVPLNDFQSRIAEDGLSELRRLEKEADNEYEKSRTSNKNQSETISLNSSQVALEEELETSPSPSRSIHSTGAARRRMSSAPKMTKED